MATPGPTKVTGQVADAPAYVAFFGDEDLAALQSYADRHNDWLKEQGKEPHWTLSTAAAFLLRIGLSTEMRRLKELEEVVG